MTGKEIRKPQKGELVGALGHSGTFVVLSVNDNTRTADLQLSNSKQLLTSVPWMALHYDTKPQKKSREDVNQAAFRIVRG